MPPTDAAGPGPTRPGLQHRSGPQARRVRRSAHHHGTSPGAAGSAHAARASGGEIDPLVQRFGGPGVVRAAGVAGADGDGASGPSATERLDSLDELVALIEARVIAELERRGGRHRGWW